MKDQSSKKTAPATEPHPTAIPIGIKRRDGIESVLDSASVRRLMDGWRLKRAIDEAQERLDGLHADLLAAHGPGCALIITGLCRASTASRQTVKVADIDRLAGVLGDRLDDLVRTQVKLVASDALIEMASDADHPLAPSLRACLTVSRSESVSWRAEPAARDAAPKK